MKRDAAVLAGLLGLGLAYAASFGVFLADSRNFVLAGRRAALVPLSLRPGDTLPLSGPGACLPCLGMGWHRPEESFTWSHDPEVVLLTPPVKREDAVPERPLVLVLDAAGAFMAPGGERRVGLRVNGRDLGEVVIHKADPRQRNFFRGAEFAHAVPLPSGLLRDGEPVRIELRVSAPEIPYVLGISGDRRPLGIAVRGLRVVPADAAPGG